MTSNRITYLTALEIVSHEAIVREAYKDSQGNWTWSVGLTSASGHTVERYIGKPQSIERCLEVYVWALQRYADDVRKRFAGTRLLEHEFAAALSFHWNTGAIGRASWCKKLIDGESEAAIRSAFMRWNKPSEIVKRRAAEADLLLGAKWSQTGWATVYQTVNSNGKIDWTSATRVNVEDELKTILDGRPPPPPDVPINEDEGFPAPPMLRQEKSFWTMVAALVAAGLAGFAKWLGWW